VLRRSGGSSGATGRNDRDHCRDSFLSRQIEAPPVEDNANEDLWFLFIADNPYRRKVRSLSRTARRSWLVRAQSAGAGRRPPWIFRWRGGERHKAKILATPAASVPRWKTHHVPTRAVVGFLSKGVGRPSITLAPNRWDEARVLAWMPAFGRPSTSISYNDRFTPRKENQRLEIIQHRRVAELDAQVRMQPAGLLLRPPRLRID